MQASALSLFLATAMAAPSLHHQHRRAHQERQIGNDIAYKTVIDTDFITKWVTAGPGGYGPPAQQATSSCDEESSVPTSAPVVVPSSTDTAAAASGSSAVAPPPVQPPVQPSESVSAPVVQPSSVAAPAPVAPVSSAAAASGYPSVAAPPASSAVAPVSSSAPAPVQAPPSSSSAVAPVQAPPSSSAAAVSSSVPAVPASSAAAPSSSAASSSSAAAPSGSGSVPFTNIVIFGDNLSDRGNGSSDHNLAGNPETIYGFKTWTDGPIAAEQLANNMKMDIVYDYAYGHAAGGSKFGATIDNTFTQSDANVPAVCDQIKNYTTGGMFNKANMGNTLHFVWGGNNDVVPWAAGPAHHLFPEAGLTDSGNTQFCTQLANLITTQAKTLTDAGAEHVFVPNVYPRHIAPVVQRYFSNDTNWVNTYGQLIQSVNTQLKTNLASLAQTSGKKVTYYDAYTFLLNTYNAAEQSGANGINMMKPGDNICDGSYTDPVPGTSSLVYCNQGHGSQYYWMQYLDMTAHVDGLLATDMQNAIQQAYSS